MLLAKQITYLNLSEVVESMDVVYDKTNTCIKQDGVIENPKNVLFTKSEKARDLSELCWTFRLNINKKEMLRHNVSLTDIKVAIYRTFQNDLFKISKKNEKDLYSRIVQVMVLSNNIHDDNHVVHARMKISNIVTLIELRTIWELFMKNIYVKGIKNIDNSVVEEREIVSFDEETGETRIEKEWMIVCKGINIHDIYKLYGVDKSRTITNDLILTLRYYGIEACRRLLIHETITIFENAGNNLNYHHFTILADIMTKHGGLTAINRYGLNKLDTDPLSKASFEQTMSELMNASIFGESDPLRSVSSRIMTGNVIKGGTGLCEVVIDVDKILKYQISGNHDKKNNSDIMLEEENI